MEEKNEIKMLEQVSAVQDAEQNLREIEKEEMTEESKEMNEFADSVITADQLAQIRALYNRKPKQQVRKYAKIGRNDPCPCGSGKKYKNCCINSRKFEGTRDI